MDRFVIKYYHYEKNENGLDIKVTNKISRKNPEHSEAFQYDQDLLILKLKQEELAMKKKKREKLQELEEEKQRRKREREEHAANKKEGINVDIVEGFEKQTINGLNVQKKTQNRRPDNWRLIGQHYNESKNMSCTLRAFEDDPEFRVKTPSAQYQAVLQYSKQCLTDYEPKLNIKHYSVLGKEIETELHDDFLSRREKGLPVASSDIQIMVRVLLKKYSLEDYLNKGFTFGDSWVRRWCRRWNVTDRVATTKMRESINPEVLRVKDEKYKEIA